MVTESDPTPSVNSHEVVYLHGAQANEKVTLTITSPKSAHGRDMEIAGVKSLVKTADASGVATFRVTVAAAGVYPITMSDASGAVLGTNTLTVAPAFAVSAAAPDAELSATGFAGTGIAMGGVGLVLVGGGVVLVTRRRRSPKAPA